MTAGVAFTLMSALADRLHSDLTVAMKAREALVVSTLRMVLSAVRTEEVAGRESRTLTDEEVLRVLAKEAKKRQESAEAFTTAGRNELAAKERAEAAVLGAYLPVPLDDGAVADVAARAVAQVAEADGAAPGMRQMGQVMSVATALAAGGADGARLSAAVRALLTR